MKEFRKRISLIFLCMLLFFGWTSTPASAWQGDSLELAFIRDSKLWVYDVKNGRTFQVQDDVISSLSTGTGTAC